MPSKYTAEQIEALRLYYPISDYEKLSDSFPGKTKKQIKSIARYYGIKNKNPGHIIDLTGNRYGLLVVESFAYTKNYKSYWNCLCDCGNERIVAGFMLTNGKTKSCGCLIHNPIPRINHVGESFGWLTAIERFPNFKNGRTYYKCECKCGNVTYVSSSSLITGKTRTCGCAQKQLKEFWLSVEHDRDDDRPVYCVYKHTAPNGKVYIGITRQNSERRWQNGFGYRTQKFFYRAICKYGWSSFVHEILEDGLTEKEACEKERYYINLYKTNNPQYGYNATDGGDTKTTTVQPIMQYYYGEPVNFFASVKVAGEELGVSPSAVNQYTKGNKDFRGYTFKKLSRIKEYDIPSEMFDIRNINHLNVKDIIEEQFKEKTIARNKKRIKPICQYSKEGQYIRSFNSIAEAKKEYPYLSVASLYGNHRSKSAYGFMWRYDNGDHSNIEPLQNKGTRRCVLQIDSTTLGVIAEYESLAEAERKTGISSKQIYKVCRGLRKATGGYIWKYKEPE